MPLLRWVLAINNTHRFYTVSRSCKSFVLVVVGPVTKLSAAEINDIFYMQHSDHELSVREVDGTLTNLRDHECSARSTGTEPSFWGTCAEDRGDGQKKYCGYSVLMVDTKRGVSKH